MHEVGWDIDGEDGCHKTVNDNDAEQLECHGASWWYCGRPFNGVLDIPHLPARCSCTEQKNCLSWHPHGSCHVLSPTFLGWQLGKSRSLGSLGTKRTTVMHSCGLS